MPWGWECRAKLIKQVPAKPTEPRGKVSCEVQGPGPQRYDPPELFCGKGYSHIKRSPAYTFGHQTPVDLSKPVVKATAPILDTYGTSSKGPYKIKCGVVSPQIEPPQQKGITPGPGNYAPRIEIRYKRPPVYTMQPAARPPYQPWDMWTPSPNMYLPHMPGKKRPPAYSFGYVNRQTSVQITPSPGTHDPNFDFVRKTKPAFSFGSPFRTSKPSKKPPPNAYCEKKFMYPKRSIPAPSFGIRHSPYLGCEAEYLMSSKQNVAISGED